jgi:hypothetical protein
MSGDFNCIRAAAIQLVGHLREILGHALKEMCRPQLAAIAQEAVDQFGGAPADRFDFEVIPGTAGSNGLGEMEQLVRDRAPVSASCLGSPARRYEGKPRVAMLGQLGKETVDLGIVSKPVKAKLERAIVANPVPKLTLHAAGIERSHHRADLIVP